MMHLRHFSDEVELTVVLPLFNEAEVIPQLYQRLHAVLTQLEISHELLFVDDGSRDATADEILTISHDDPTVTGVFLTRHFGKEAALAAGLAQASGQGVIIMDGDLQDPPELIPRMLSAWRNGADVVRMRPHRMLNAICDVEIPRNSVDFMLYSRKAVAALDLLVNRKQYMQPMFAWLGFREIVIEYARLTRAAGSSKWSLVEWVGERIKHACRPMKRPGYSIEKIVRSPGAT